jgi:hypothetical protein
VSVEKLLKFIQSDNIAEMLEDEQLREIVENATNGFDIDEESCKEWIRMNKEALRMIKAETKQEHTKNYAHSQVIYPLLASATIQLASRLIPHLVRNNKVAECAVLGPDPEGIKAAKAATVSAFFSYDLLIDSDSWLKESHKLIHMVSAWGTGYRKLYFDEGQDKVLSEVLSPEDVVINSNTASLDKARRITIRNYMTKNEIIEYIRSNKFSEVDVDTFKIGVAADENQDITDTNPVYEILEQLCYIDLDEDGYEEPYIVYFNKDSKTVLGIYAGYDVEDIHVNDKSEVKKIIPRPYVIDYHCIDDPAGKYHSMGLNHLLFHQNKSITSILRQLIDSGTLANQQGGFTTKAFKTKKREIKQELGKFTQLEIPPNVDIRSQIMPLPFKEPSQVLFSLLGLLIDAGKETGFVTQALMGDSEGQNVPATTMLAIVEQGTRAFKPMVQKLFHSLKKEFKMMFYLYGKFSNLDRFIRYQDLDLQISKDVFDASQLDIMPVADPTQSSEAHVYMKIQALQQMLQTPLANVLNIPELGMRILKGLQIDNPEKLILPPQPQQPDPKMLEVQLKQQVANAQIQLDQVKEQREGMKTHIDMLKAQIKQQELQIIQQGADAKNQEVIAKAHKDQQEANVKDRLATVAEQKVGVEHARLDLLAKQQQHDNSNKNN